MLDPLEGITAEGMITTGADRHRVPAEFETVLGAVSEGLVTIAPNAAVYLYGSVATGQARVGESDVDLIAIGADADLVRRFSGALSERFNTLCRGVEIASADAGDLVGDLDEAYGFRVFLRHYCVHVAGPARHRPGHDFRAGVRAARGFNGDIARAERRWREVLADTDSPGYLATRVARKTLLAVAGLVSVHDDTWTTDRSSAAHRWSEIEPQLAEGLSILADWADGAGDIDHRTVERLIASTVIPLVERFTDRIGLWSTVPRQDTSDVS